MRVMANKEQHVVDGGLAEQSAEAAEHATGSAGSVSGQPGRLAAPALNGAEGIESPGLEHVRVLLAHGQIGLQTGIGESPIAAALLGH